MEKIDMITALEKEKADAISKLDEGEDSSTGCIVIKSQICSFWKKGKCKRGTSCSFAHGTTEMNKSVVLKSISCPFHRAGLCRLGDECRNSHAEVESQAADSQHNMAAVRRRATLCHFQLELGYCKLGDRCLGAHSEKELIQPGENSRARAHAKFADKQKAIGARREPDQENPRMITKKLICTFWEKGRCTRGSYCSFAHGSEELNQTAQDQFYKTSICRYFKAGRCQLGNECRQAHAKQELPNFAYCLPVTDFKKSDEYKEFADPPEL